MNQHTRVGRGGAVAMIAALATALPVATAHGATSPSTSTSTPASTAPASVAQVSTAPTPATRSAPFRQTLLIFGTARPDGGPDVTPAQFWTFVDQIVTPRFPDGLTVSEAQGQWRDHHGVIEREKSYEIYLLYPTTNATRDSAAIDEIRDLYKQRFAQESVARIDELVRVDF